MKYKIQKSGPLNDLPLKGVSPQMPPLRDVKVESSELLQTTKALRAELQDMRASISKLGKRVEGIEADAANFRKEISQVTTGVSRLNTHLDSMAKAMQETTTALGSAAQAVEDQHQRERQSQAAVSEELQRQRLDLDSLTTAMKEGREQVGRQLVGIAEKEGRFQQAGAEIARALTELIQKLDRQTHERLGRLAEGIQLLVQSEQASVTQLAEGHERVLSCEKNLSELLVGVSASLGDLTRLSEQVLDEDQRAGKDHLLSEAARLNTIGMMCLADGHYEEAVRKFEEARQCAPSAFEPAFNLAVAHLHSGHPAEAAQLAGELLAGHPDRRELRLLRGIASLRGGDFTAARQHLASVAEREVESESVLTAAGLAHLFSDDSKSAAAAFRRAAESPQPQAQVLRQIGFENANAA